MVNTIQDILDAVQDIFEAELKALLDAARQQTELVFWIVRRNRWEFFFGAFWVGKFLLQVIDISSWQENVIHFQPGQSRSMKVNCSLCTELNVFQSQRSTLLAGLQQS